VSLLGTNELMFTEPGVKINGAYYRDVLLGRSSSSYTKTSVTVCAQSGRRLHGHMRVVEHATVELLDHAHVSVQTAATLSTNCN